MARKRKRLGRRQSRKSFTRASGSHRRNYRTNPMRGGIRL